MTSTFVTSGASNSRSTARNRHVCERLGPVTRLMLFPARLVRFIQKPAVTRLSCSAFQEAGSCEASGRWETSANNDHACMSEQCRDYGFAIGFSAQDLPVDLNLDLLGPLLAQTRELFESPVPPIGRPGCKDCELTERLNG